MNQARLIFFVIMILAGSVFSACQSVPTGPSLTNLTFSPAIETAAVWRTAQKATIGDPSVCCCHILGAVNNNNSVPTHVIIRFAARDASDSEVGSVVSFIQDLQPHTRRDVEVSGFLVPCQRIDHVLYSISVSSVDAPIL